MNDEIAPSSVEIPMCLLSNELFSGSLAGEHIKDRVFFKMDQPEERLHFQLKYNGSHLGPEHLKFWKAMYVQRVLRGRGEFEISVRQMMQLLGYVEGCEEQQQRVHDVLDDFDMSHLTGEGVWYTKGGRRRRFGFGSSLGSFHLRDGIYQAWVGPSLEGFPDGVALEVVPVSRLDIEIASNPPPPPPRAEPQWLAEQPEPEPTRKPKPSGPGFVYILTNPSMPGLIKIGKTRLACVEDRAAQLHSTGVPDAFEVAYACRTDDPDAVERVMHEAFGPKRVNGRREFFQIEPGQAIAILALHGQGEPVAGREARAGGW